jgi:hypothetical protein
VENVFVNPCFNYEEDGPNRMDLAVIKFNEPVEGVMPYPIYTGGDEVGK